ncbi:protein sprouty homolog 4 [Falco biarmicus]|uniref:protein sprouty homolog 4 n=1 Tax=Falco cherrug TaxID=345164 RepID=UPI000392D441|nr:protein sprouty homolog 4 [Falco cherrug]XP_037254281.1 protein sprouty homolog 4 [Falco rusticolus]XP_055575254.1 protein sprouty homolog 4 [Falco cherrug]XP_056206172.1 protein sprouty homolog 4 [Falco biarmicus]XP_056206173.1 protein sprouty homolog 4 [Falco biarmicus]
MEPRIPHNITIVPNSVMVQPLLDSRIPYGRLQHPLTILPIDQMKTTHIENDYTDNPTASQLADQKRPQGSHELVLTNQHLQRCEQDVTHPWISFSGRPSSISSSSSTSSDQRLLDHMAPAPVAEQSSPRAVRIQPKVINCKPLDLKGPVSQELDKHFLLCEACGKCKCKECALPRTLPSCWVCNQECLCSAQNLVNYSTCMCLVKGIFYHCTNEDDEGTCADHPCSCSHSNCCARWSFMSALSLVFPCLLCYLPATGCVKLSQRCYDQVSRPGCRCKNTNSVICKALPESKGSRPEKPF